MSSYCWVGIVFFSFNLICLTNFLFSRPFGVFPNHLHHISLLHDSWSWQSLPPSADCDLWRLQTTLYGYPESHLTSPAPGSPASASSDHCTECFFSCINCSENIVLNSPCWTHRSFLLPLPHLFFKFPHRWSPRMASRKARRWPSTSRWLMPTTTRPLSPTSPTASTFSPTCNRGRLSCR